MIWAQHDYDDIPGSYIFDGRMTVQGYGLNRMCMSFNDAENREEFIRDEEAYCRVPISNTGAGVVVLENTA